MWLWLQNVLIAVFENYELSSMTLKYKRECSQSNVLQSMCSPTSCIAELEKEAEVEVNGVGCSYTAGFQTSIPDVQSVYLHTYSLHICCSCKLMVQKSFGVKNSGD
jgi:hypothetical protein